MRSTGLLFWAAVGLALTACGARGEDVDESEGAATADSGATLTSGHYGDLDLVVKNGVVSGHVFSSVGDPARGGATCEFTFAGKVGASGQGREEAAVTAVDGFDIVAGTLRATKGGERIGERELQLKLTSTLSACGRALGPLEDGVQFTGQRDLESGIAGYRTVQARKAFFRNAPDAAPRRAFVVQGDALMVTDDARADFKKVTYLKAGVPSPTSGFVAAADLVAVDTTPPAILGAFKLRSGDVSSRIVVKSLSSGEVTFDLEAVINSGSGHNGAIDSGRAKLQGDAATFTSGGDCRITMTLDAAKKGLDVRQEGTCSEGAGFGAYLDVSGHYDRDVPSHSPAIGAYALQSSDVSASLDIVAVSGNDVSFDLEAVLNSGSGHNGAIQGGHAVLAGNVATFRSEADCEIQMTLGADSVDLRQNGPCAEGAGFGAFLDVSGHYARKER